MLNMYVVCVSDKLFVKFAIAGHLFGWWTQKRRYVMVVILTCVPSMLTGGERESQGAFVKAAYDMWQESARICGTAKVSSRLRSVYVWIYSAADECGRVSPSAPSNVAGFRERGASCQSDRRRSVPACLHESAALARLTWLRLLII